MRILLVTNGLNVKSVHSTTKELQEQGHFVKVINLHSISADQALVKSVESYQIELVLLFSLALVSKLALLTVTKSNIKVFFYSLKDEKMMTEMDKIKCKYITKVFMSRPFSQSGKGASIDRLSSIGRNLLMEIGEVPKEKKPLNVDFNKVIAVIESFEEGNMHFTFGRAIQELCKETIVFPWFRKSNGHPLVPGRDYAQLFDSVYNQYKPDAIIVCGFGDIASWVLGEGRREAVTVNWQVDDPFGFKIEHSKYSSYFDVVLTTHKPSIEYYKNRGQFCEWMNFGFDPLVFKKPLSPVTQDIDVSFYGTMMKGREQILNGLQAKGIKVKVFGRAANKILKPTEIPEVVHRSKINIAFSDQPDGYMYFKCRHFEIPACGGFMLAEDFDDLSLCYNKGETGRFIGEKDLVQNIRYYLSNNDLREEIAEKGYKKVQEYTMAKQIEKSFKELGGKGNG